MSQARQYRISPTTGLNQYNDCKRCFWLHYNAGLQRPRGIFPSLPGGIDLILKNYFDRYRGSVPPEIRGKVKGVLMKDLKLMNKWRDWRTGLNYKDNILNTVFFGALDDCLVSGDKYIPLDYKTKGSAPNPGDSERYYQTQLDAYAFLLESNGYQTDGVAYLAYYYPEKGEKEGMIKFGIEVVEVKVDPSRCLNLLEESVKVLRGPIPEPSGSCEYCDFVARRKRYSQDGIRIKKEF